MAFSQLYRGCRRKTCTYNTTSCTGSEFFNYKKTFSIILLAVTGPEYECLYTDIGSNSRMNDSGVWNSSDLRQKIENNEQNIPDSSPLPFTLCICRR